MDQFGRTVEWSMFVGDEKGPIIDKILHDTKPKIALELGTYCGYSAVRFGTLLRQYHPDAKYYTLEPNPEHYEVATKIIRFAGLENTVKVIKDTLDHAIDDALRSIEKFDFVFIDHAKNRYLSDFKLLESHHVFKKGTVIVADNLIYPGAPGYWDYVSTKAEYACQFIKAHLEYETREDAIGVAVCQ
jgi:catechol O-methyltransferase